MRARQGQTGLHMLQGSVCLLAQLVQHGGGDQGEREGERMRLRASPWFVARIDEHPVGLVCVISEPGAPADERHMVALWVAPEHRGSGVAAGLLGAAETWARGDGATLMSLWVVDGNETAEQLYGRCGYAASGVRMPVPRDRTLTEERWTKTLAGDAAQEGSPVSPASLT